MSAELWRRRPWQLIAISLCFLFGLAFIVNVHPIGDGLWFWYAVLLRGGHRLYADMHLPLQPLFVLLTAWTQELLGNGWLASKALAVAQLAAYCVGILLIAGYARWKDWETAILIPAVFGLSIASSYSRFDDYHITGYCIEVWSIYLLLRTSELLLRTSEEHGLRTAAALGVLAGLSTSNRLNDGAALFVACGLLLPFFVTRQRRAGLAVFCSMTALTLLGVIALTGDSVRDWALNSILRAAAIKGGTGNVLMAPLMYPHLIDRSMRHDPAILHSLGYVLVVILICVLTERYARRGDGRWSPAKIALGLGALAAVTFQERGRFALGGPLRAVTTVSVLVAYALCVWLAVRLLRMTFRPGSKSWDRRQLLLLIPVLQIPGTTLTTIGAAHVLEVYGQAAILLLLIPLSLPLVMRGEARKTAFLAMAGLIAISAAITKTEHPYYWHHFINGALFRQRQWYRHPVYGPMYIERDQLQLMQSICANIGADGPPTELLSITNPYPNYFCNVTPWHGYVQTWYDTSSRQTIDTLIGELQNAPPRWIVYQRAEDSMSLHEEVSTGGRPLPHRALDRLIVDRIGQGQWHIVERQKFEGADWIVVRTRP